MTGEVHKEEQLSIRNYLLQCLNNKRRVFAGSSVKIDFIVLSSLEQLKSKQFPVRCSQRTTFI